MVTITDGTTTMDGTELTLWDTTADGSYGGLLFMHNMAAADIVRVRVYVRDDNDGTAMRLIYDETLEDAQVPEGFVIPTIPAGKHKVTLQQSAGTNRVITWIKAVY